jgi:hypothetical protein
MDPAVNYRQPGFLLRSFDFSVHCPTLAKPVRSLKPQKSLTSCGENTGRNEAILPQFQVVRVRCELGFHWNFAVPKPTSCFRSSG